MPPDHARRSSRTVEWARTLIACGLLLGGLLTILPMLPDKDQRGVFNNNSHSNATQEDIKPATTSMLIGPDGTVARDGMGAQPASAAHRIHRT